MAANKCFFRPCNGKDDWKACGPAGINTIINRSNEKDDELYKQFSDNTAAVVCHKSCYSSYTSLTRNTVISGKRKSVKGELECEPPNRLSRSMIAGQVINIFDFKRDCMFCGNACIPQDPKHPDRWEKVRECQTDKRPGRATFKYVVIDMCDQRADDWSRLVENRINGVLADLPAADARYHDKCYQEFRYVPVDSTKSVTGKSVDDSLKRVIVHMRANRVLTWTVAELYSIYVQNAGEISRRQMLHQLSSFFGEEMLVIQVEGCNTLVGFKKDNEFEDELDATFGEEEVTHDQIMQIGRKFFLALYAQKQSPTLNAARYGIFRKRKKAPPLKNLPPTDCNALIHFLRVHGQCMLWKGADKPDPPTVDICACGWQMKDGVPMPAVYPAPIAPPKLLDVVSCQCGTQTLKPCTTGRCSCRRAGIQCTR